MLIEQIIKKQILSLLDVIIQSPSEINDIPNKQNVQKTFTAQQFTDFNLRKGIIKQDQRQILIILLNNYLEAQHKKNNEFEYQQNNFTSDQAYVILKSIKKGMIEQGQLTNSQKYQDSTDIKFETINQDSQNNQLIPKKLQKNLYPSISFQNSQNTYRSTQNHPIKQKMIYQTQNNKLGDISTKLKKQNQFIARNINRIKNYATNFGEVRLPLDQIQIQQIKICHQISSKLFHLYKSAYPRGISNNKQIQINNFQTKEQYKSTLNYHKILQMFIEMGTKLQIQNKLSLLRVIKKFAFNPHFIQIEEWIKIYRGIMNNFGIKQIQFERLVKIKEEKKKNSKLPIILISTKKKTQKEQYQSRRIKTQVSIQKPDFKSVQNIDKSVNQYHSQKIIQEYMNNKSSVRPIEPWPKNQTKTYNPNQYRSRHKKLLTDLSQVFIKNVQKQMRSEKMIGLEDNKKEQKNPSLVVNEQFKHQFSYLKKAMKNKKIAKITWQSLFQMKQDTIYHNITIPQFAKLLDLQNNSNTARHLLCQ